jgi:hypothetical protein
LSIEGVDGRVLAVGYLSRDEAKRIKELVERQAAEARRDRAESPRPDRQSAADTETIEVSGPPPLPEGRSGDADVPELMRKLAELKDAGVITDEEFEAKEADLLDRQRRAAPRRRRRRK